jgi:hypothetical protein
MSAATADRRHDDRAAFPTAATAVPRQDLAAADPPATDGPDAAERPNP